MKTADGASVAVLGNLRSSCSMTPVMDKMGGNKGIGEGRGHQFLAF